MSGRVWGGGGGPVHIMLLWFALLPMLLLVDGADGRARKQTRRSNKEHRTSTQPHHQQGAGVEMELQFDGDGKLGLAFVKGSMPLKIRHVTPNTWASRQAELHPGMELVSVGATTLIGRSYIDAIDLLREATSVSSDSARLSLTFVSHSVLSSVDGSDKLRRLLAACASVRERDLQAADRHLSAFLAANGRLASDRDPAKCRDLIDRVLHSDPGELRVRLAFALHLAVRADLEVEAATIASSTAGAGWGNHQQALQQKTVDCYNDVAEAAAAVLEPRGLWPQHIELAALGRSSAYSWSMRKLGPAILAQRRVVELIKDCKDPDKLLTVFEQSETHTQLGILLTTRGSVINSTADHVEAAREFSRARELSPVDPYPRA